jgi:Dynamin GTPase effector domain
MCARTSRVCDSVTFSRNYRERLSTLTFDTLLLLVAYKRFVDNVPKAVDEMLVLGVAKELQGALVNGLGLDSPDAHERCARYLAEPPRIAEKRERLVARQKRLMQAQEELQNVFT